MGGPAGAAQLRRYILPAAASGQDEPQDFHDAAVVDGRPAAGWAYRRLGRQMVSGQIEKRIRHPGNGHDRCLLRGATPSQQSSGVPG
jgi:hypothetical protein